MGEEGAPQHAGAVTFRPIRPEDAGFLYEVYASTRQDELAPVGWTAAQRDAFLRMQFNAQDQSYRVQFPNADFHIVLWQERPIGRLYVERHADEILGIDIALLPAYRQAGIGTAILQDLFAEAARVGKPFRFYVEKLNQRARRLYARLGCTTLADDGVFLFMEWLPASRGTRAVVTFANDLDPIIISAPTVRSGTTLLQRLLCSATNALIFGENCAQDLELFLGIYTSKCLMYNYYRGRFTETLERVNSGATDDWILDLMPDMDGYLQALGRSCFAGMAYCREYARRAGRPVWGVKYPGWKPQTMQMLRDIMPQCRLLYVYRDVYACLQSAKARQLIRSEHEVRAFCTSWVENLTYGLKRRSESRVVLLCYEQMIAQPAATLAHIGTFTGADGMSLGVFGNRINSWREDTDEGYVQPAELHTTERQIMDEITSELRTQLGYATS